MSTWVVGDVQGCFGELMRTLTKARFDPAHDTLWAVGDLVNRGPESLATLRFFYQLGDAARIVLGNHDLHLLAVAEGIRPIKRGDTVQAILDAADAAELLNWLRQQPLLLKDDTSRSLMVHAGIPPCWNPPSAAQPRLKPACKARNTVSYWSKCTAMNPIAGMTVCVAWRAIA